jgi:hypothetical protein
MGLSNRFDALPFSFTENGTGIPNAKMGIYIPLGALLPIVYVFYIISNN